MRHPKLQRLLHQSIHFDGKSNQRAPSYNGFGTSGSVCSASEAKSSFKPKRQPTHNSVIATVNQEGDAQPSIVETDFELPMASPLDP